MQSRWLKWVGIVALGMAVTIVPTRSLAQSAEVAADYKGAVGLGLIGAEVGAVVPALCGLDDLWAFLVFPAVGAAGGAIGGYFAIDRAGHAELSVAMLTAGMALVIPALVVTLAATAYDPGDDEAAEAKAPRRPGAVPALARSQRRQLAAGSGMLRVSDGELALGVPGVALLSGVQQGSTRLSGASVSVLSGRF
jgi:hypothetical protein